MGAKTKEFGAVRQGAAHAAAVRPSGGEVPAAATPVFPAGVRWYRTRALWRKIGLGDCPRLHRHHLAVVFGLFTVMVA